MLDFFHEAGLPLVYHKGEYYLLAEEAPEGFVVEEGEVEVTSSPNVRQVIAEGEYLPDDSYLPYWTEGADFTRGVSYEYEQGYLPDARKRAYKVVSGVEGEYIVKKEGKSYCVRNGCDDCEGSKDCKFEGIERVEGSRRYDLVVCDISAQEPQILAIMSREPNFLQTFRNRELRKAKLLDYLDVAYGEYFKRDPNSYRESSVYWEWVDERFNADFRELVYFNDLVERLKQGEEVEGEIEGVLEKWLGDLEVYISARA